MSNDTHNTNLWRVSWPPGKWISESLIKNRNALIAKVNSTLSKICFFSPYLCTDKESSIAIMALLIKQLTPYLPGVYTWNESHN